MIFDMWIFDIFDICLLDFFWCNMTCEAMLEAIIWCIGEFEVQPNLCLVLWIVLNSMIVIGVSLVANVGILANLKK
jgi:hypothetical protein